MEGEDEEYINIIIFIYNNMAQQREKRDLWVRPRSRVFRHRFEKEGYVVTKKVEKKEKKEVVCPHCGYRWTPRVNKPKQCPYCKRYLETKK